MSDHSPSKLSPTAGAFIMPGAVQTPLTNEMGELEFTRPEFSAQTYEISSVRSNYGDYYGDHYGDHYGGSNYGDNYHPVNNQYNNEQYGPNYYPNLNNNGSTMYGNNGSSNYVPQGYGGDFKKNKGHKSKNKNMKNNPQYRNQPAPYYTGGEQPAQYYMGGEQPMSYYMGEQTPYPATCEVKQKALAEGLTVVCVGCGAFGNKLPNGNKGHNWTSIHNMEYSSYLNAPICPHGSAAKKQYGGDRQMAKKFERSESHTKKQPTHSNKSNTGSASKQDHETQTTPAKVNDRDNQTQTENVKLNDRDKETQTSPTKETHESQASTSAPAQTKKPKSRPNSLMISGWSATIPLQLQNIIDNIPAMYQDGTYNAHERIKFTIDIFQEFVNEYEAVLEENKMLKSQAKDAGGESKEAEALAEKMGELGVGQKKEIDVDDDEKNGKEYLGYTIEK